MRMLGAITRNGAWRKAVRQTVQLFSGAVSPQEAQRINRWQSAAPEHKDAFQAAVDTWSGLEALANDPDILAIAETAPPPTLSQRLQEHWPAAAVAASLVLGLSIALGAWLYHTPFQHQAMLRYSTAIGERKTVTLPDGSVINLNTASRLLLDFTNDYRRAILDRGEAFFDIAKDPRRPFTVEVSNRAITVLGTKFNVQKNREQLTVAVVEGLVALHRREDSLSTVAPTLGPSANRQAVPAAPADQYRLQAGTVVAITGKAEDKLEVLPAADITHIASWRTGVIRFEGQPLYKVVQEINRYTAQKILIEDAGVMELSVNAVLHLDRLDAILAGLEASLPIQVNRYFDSIVIVGRNNGEER